MKIGIDASRINLEQKTGTEWYSYYIIKNILDIDVENQYFLFSREDLPKEFLAYKNVKNIVLKWPFKRFWTIIRLSLALKKYKLDLFFSPSHNSPKTKLKKVITWHDLAYEYFPEYYSKLQLLSLKSGARKLKKANRIIVPSEFTKRDIVKKYNINKDKISVVYHGIDFDKYCSKLKKCSVLKKYILYIGRLESKKNIVALIKSFNNYRDNYNEDIDLVLLGGEGIGFKDVKSEVNLSKYKKNIHILGWVNDDDKLFILKNASLFINLSNFEGFGMPILEAALCKIPMLISDLQVFREFGMHDYSYINNMYMISEKINAILNGNDLVNNIVNINYEIAKKYSWKRSAQKTLRAFRR